MGGRTGKREQIMEVLKSSIKLFISFVSWLQGLKVNKVFSSKSNQAVASLFQNSQCPLISASYQLRAFALTDFDSAWWSLIRAWPSLQTGQILPICLRECKYMLMKDYTFPYCQTDVLLLNGELRLKILIKWDTFRAIIKFRSMYYIDPIKPTV